MSYCDNFWHTEGDENISPGLSPACFIFFEKLKTEDQLITFEAASDWNVLGIQMKA